MKLLIISVLAALLLMTGCQTNHTSEFCTAMKHANKTVANNVTVYMDGNVCILEQINYTDTFLINCDSLTDSIDFIFKTSNTTLDDMDLGKMNMFCDVMKI